MNINRPQVGVDVFVFNTDTNKILLGTRQKESKWSLPGGKLEYTETFEICAKRLLLEETNLKIDINRFKFLCSFNALNKDEGFHWAAINYILKLTQEEEKEIQNKEDKTIKGWKWFTFEEVSKMYSDLFIPLQIFITKYKIDSFEKIVNLKSN